MNSFNRVLLSVIGSAALTATLSAQTVTVTGTGDPNLDVPAVQSAVDQGGSVALTGHFSFDRPPTTPAGATINRMVTVSKNVVISGSLDQNGDLPTIRGGDWPFLVDAQGAQVTIQGLHFVRPTSGAIWIYAVGGLQIAGCRVQGMEPSAEFALQAGQAGTVSTAIFVGADPHPPSANQLGQPANFSGTLTIRDNDIDIGGIAHTLGLGIAMFNVGKSPDKEVDIFVSGNKIINATEPAINLRVIGGRAFVQRNVIVTGALLGDAANPDAIRVVGAGSYVIAHNSIDCGWPDGTAAAINMIGQGPPLVPVQGAVVVDNDITMSAPAGTVFGNNSAAIEIRGYALGNSVLNNRIRGRANAALTVLDQNAGLPGHNSFLLNDLTGFQSTLADIFIDVGATNTLIIGRQTGMQDSGSGTVAVPMR
jgi:hypothetical protein